MTAISDGKTIKNPNLRFERSLVRLEVVVGLLLVLRKVGLKSWRNEITLFWCFGVFVGGIEFLPCEFVPQVWY